MTGYIKVNGGAADTTVQHILVKTSVAERLPYVEIVVDNTNNAGMAAYAAYDEVEVFMGPRGSEIVVFAGYIEDKTAEGASMSLRLRGRGFALLMADSVIDILTYAAKTSSYIVDNLRQTYGRDGGAVQVITGLGINVTGDSITRTLKGVTAWDAALDLAIDLGYDIWVDNGKDLHFETRAFSHSGVSIDADDIVFSADRAETASQAINRVTVYGGGSPQVVGRADDYGGQLDLGVVRSKFIYDSSLTLQTEVDARATRELSRIVGMPTKYEVVGVGWETVQAGECVHVDLPQFDVPPGDYYVLEKMMEYPPSRTTLTLYAYSSQLQDIILDIVKEIRKLRQQSLSSSISTKVLRFNEMLSLDARVRMYKRTVGTAFHGAFDSNGSTLGFSGTALTGPSGQGAETLVYDSG